jgi:hypothetical protein
VFRKVEFCSFESLFCPSEQPFSFLLIRFCFSEKTFSHSVKQISMTSNIKVVPPKQIFVLQSSICILQSAIFGRLERRAILSQLYETFPPAQAFRLAQKLELHFTPKHGSWLDIAEVELSALTAQCLGVRRIGNIDILNAELSAWDTQRNRKQKGVDWQFTTEDARIKLKRLYPQIVE